MWLFSFCNIWEHQVWILSDCYLLRLFKVIAGSVWFFDISTGCIFVYMRAFIPEFPWFDVSDHLQILSGSSFFAPAAGHVSVLTIWWAIYGTVDFFFLVYSFLLVSSAVVVSRNFLNCVSDSVLFFRFFDLFLHYSSLLSTNIEFFRTASVAGTYLSFLCWFIQLYFCFSWLFCSNFHCLDLRQLQVDFSLFIFPIFKFVCSSFFQKFMKKRFSILKSEDTWAWPERAVPTRVLYLLSFKLCCAEGTYTK